MTQPGAAGGSTLEQPLLGVASPDVATLPFDVELTYSCPADTARGQLFVSVADSWRLEEAPAASSPLMMRIDVPIRQLQWLRQPEAVCRDVTERREPDEVDDRGIRYFRLRAEASGHAMLSCTGKDGRISAASSAATLDVWLSCPATEPSERSPVSP